jgi:hypothetical protein
MKTTQIGNLTIHRVGTYDEWKSLVNGLMPIEEPVTVWETKREDGPSDEEILADVECAKLLDDEASADHARDVRRIIVVPEGLLDFDDDDPTLITPPAQCIANRERSIRIRQSLIAADLLPEYTPLV